MYNYSALWVRLLFLVAICVIFIIILLLSIKKLKIWEKIVGIILVTALLLFGSINTIIGLVSPKIKTITGYYECEFKQRSLSPFEKNYVFINDNDKLFLELDSFSKQKIFAEEFQKDKEYIVSYEENTNLIIAVSRGK